MKCLSFFPEMRRIGERGLVLQFDIYADSLDIEEVST